MKGRTQEFLSSKVDPLKVDGSQTLILNFKIRFLIGFSLKKFERFSNFQFASRYAKSLIKQRLHPTTPQNNR